MARQQSGPRVLTGNRLSDGMVVFLSGEGRWLDDISRARLADSPEAAAMLEHEGAAAKAANIIVDPYLVEVEADDGAAGLVPVRLRERMRIAGPTVGHSLAGNGRAGTGGTDA